LYQPSQQKKSPGNAQMGASLKETALVSQRFGVSDTATAAIVTSAFKDAGLITTDKLDVTNRYKI